MKRLLIIGSGNIAKRIIPLLHRRYRMFALVRKSADRSHLRTLGVTPVAGDLDDGPSLERLAGLADTVLHFAPAPPNGLRDTRTRHLLAALSLGTMPKQLVYISTSGVYGDCGGAAVNESHSLAPQTARAQRRVDAEEQIRSWAKRNRVRAVILRVPGIYAADRLPLERLRQGTPCIFDGEDSYTNHIHADDLARIAVAAVRNGSPCRIYHASDDSEMKMGEYFDAVADAFGLQRPPRICRADALRMLPESMLSFMVESRRLTNQRLKRELKVRLQYPTVEDWLVTVKPP